MYRFSPDFDWLVLGDQEELDDKLGIWEYQLGAISRFMEVSEQYLKREFKIFNTEDSNTMHLSNILHSFIKPYI